MKEELLEELKIAMREKDELRKDTITGLRAAILQVEKDTQKKLTKKDMEIIVAKEVKKRKESFSDYEKANRQDIIENLKREIEILSKYLPKQLTIEEIELIVRASIEKLGATTPKQMGLVMRDINEKIAGKADGKQVSEMVKKLLGEN
ncbi:MAG: GatB/YqeY domain-containing protein [Clostridia bacterium]